MGDTCVGNETGGNEKCPHCGIVGATYDHIASCGMDAQWDKHEETRGDSHCPSCGLSAFHASQDQCIAALRNELAELAKEVERLTIYGDEVTRRLQIADTERVEFRNRFNACEGRNTVLNEDRDRLAAEVKEWKRGSDALYANLRDKTDLCKVVFEERARFAATLAKVKEEAGAELAPNDYAVFTTTYLDGIADARKRILAIIAEGEKK